MNSSENYVKILLYTAVQGSAAGTGTPGADALHPDSPCKDRINASVLRFRTVQSYVPLRIYPSENVSSKGLSVRRTSAPGVAGPEADPWAPVYSDRITFGPSGA